MSAAVASARPAASAGSSVSSARAVTVSRGS
jgi:hypothetical protein